MIRQHHSCSSVSLFTEQGKYIYMNSSVYLFVFTIRLLEWNKQKNDVQMVSKFSVPHNLYFDWLTWYVTCSKIHVHIMEALQINWEEMPDNLCFPVTTVQENNYVEVKYSSQAETPLKSHSAPPLFL